MVYYSLKDILALERLKRLNIINSVTGIKPANLIGTISDEGKANLAIFSSVVHLGSNPPLLGFMLRPHYEVRRHTYENILATGFYTINHVHESFAENAHYTSAKFDKDQSEFEVCGLAEEYLYGFQAPFVRESSLKMGMKFLEALHIKQNDTNLVIGEIQHLIIPDKSIEEEGHVDLSMIDDVGISGLHSYYSLKKIAKYPFARPDELPDFGDKKNGK
jgi:flavin reductase (DIM6/NTAB) family NADH-FMN oxidoreductase RutF